MICVGTAVGVAAVGVARAAFGVCVGGVGRIIMYVERFCDKGCDV